MRLKGGKKSLSLLYPQARRGAAFTAPRAVDDQQHDSESRSVGRSVACLSNLVQGAEINSMLFLPLSHSPPPLCLAIQLHNSVVCSQHVANRVNDVDACRKSQSVGVATTRIPLNDGFFWFLASRSVGRSVGRPFSSNIMDAVELAPLSPQRRSLSLFKRVRSFA